MYEDAILFWILRSCFWVYIYFPFLAFGSDKAALDHHRSSLPREANFFVQKYLKSIQMCTQLEDFCIPHLDILLLNISCVLRVSKYSAVIGIYLKKKRKTRAATIYPVSKFQGVKFASICIVCFSPPQFKDYQYLQCASCYKCIYLCIHVE